jgi:hypothetical protein
MSSSTPSPSSDEKISDGNDSPVVMTADWDGPDDPKNPKNFALWRKWVMVFIVSFSSLCV